MSLKAQRTYEPVQVRNLTLNDFISRTLEQCVMEGDPACNYKQGEIVDHPLVITIFTIYC